MKLVAGWSELGVGSVGGSGGVGWGNGGGSQTWEEEEKDL